MAITKIYAEGASSGSSFHLVSKWTVSSDGTMSGPQAGTTTINYDFSVLPAGSRINKADAYAIVGARFTPNTGRAGGYPKANGVSMTKLSEDGNLYIAENVITDISTTTRVTYSFKAKGSTSASGSGSMSFDDVYLLVDYTPPSSEWHLTESNVLTTENIEGIIVLTDENMLYSHVLALSVGDTELTSLALAAGESHFSIPIDADWMASYPNSQQGAFDLVLSTYNADGILLGTSAAEIVTIECGNNMGPEGTQKVSPVLGFGSLYIQNVSSALLEGTNLSGKGGASITSVSFSANGKTSRQTYADGSSAEDCSYNCGTLKSAGTMTATMTVTDSRGMTSTLTQTFEVTEYTPITITAMRLSRLASDSSTGYIRIDYTYTPVSYYSNGLPISNEITQSGEISGQPVFIEQEYVSGTGLEFLSGKLSDDELYPLNIYLSDGITVATMSKTIGSKSAFMRWEPANNAVGFGCYPTQRNCIQISEDWDLYLGSESLAGLIQRQSSAQTSITVSAEEPASPVEGMIWLDIS